MRLILLTVMALFAGTAVHSQSNTMPVDWALLEATADQRYPGGGSASLKPWRALLEELENAPLQTQLQSVNDYFNGSTRWTTDQDLFGQSDYWATPLETMALKAGDCEDFSIAKYVTLLSLGVEAESLRMVYVKANRPGLGPQAHMVLAWYQSASATPLILDNLNQQLLPASQRPDLLPIFSFNHIDLWLGTNSKRTGRDPRARMARWQQVLGKTRAEGMLAVN